MPGSFAQPSWVPGQRHRPERRPVVGPIAGEDLVPAGRVARELDGVLDRLGATEREEDLVHVARQDLGQLRPEPCPDLRGERRLDVLELRRLRRDRVDDAAVAMADVDRHQLAVEVEDPLALWGVQVDALGAIDRDRDRRRPGPTTRRTCARASSATISSLVMAPASVVVPMGHLGWAWSLVRHYSTTAGPGRRIRRARRSACGARRRARCRAPRSARSGPRRR